MVDTYILPKLPTTTNVLPSAEDATDVNESDPLNIGTLLVVQLIPRFVDVSTKLYCGRDGMLLAAINLLPSAEVAKSTQGNWGMLDVVQVCPALVDVKRPSNAKAAIFDPLADEAMATHSLGARVLGDQIWPIEQDPPITNMQASPNHMGGRNFMLNIKWKRCENFTLFASEHNREETDGMPTCLIFSATSLLRGS